MSRVYNNDVRFYTCCQFQRHVQNFKECHGILYTPGVDWLVNHLRCSWLVFDIAYQCTTLNPKHKCIQIQFRTRKTRKRKSIEKYTGYLTWNDMNGFKIVKHTKYPACDLIVADSKRCPLTLFLIYNIEQEKYVLMLPSEY